MLRWSIPARDFWLRAILRWLPLVLAPLLSTAQESVKSGSLEFVKGPAREVIDNVYDSIRSVAVSEGTIEATLISFGKAPPLSTPLLAKLKAKDREVYHHAREIESALKLRQGDKQFYVRVFASVPVFEMETGKKVSCRVVLVSIRTADGVSYLPLIKSVTPR